MEAPTTHTEEPRLADEAADELRVEPYYARPGRAIRRRKGWLWLSLLVLIGAGVYVERRHLPQLQAKIAALAQRYLPQAQSAKPAAPPGGRAVPVTTATARRGDMNIYLDGLGTVTAFNPVTVRTRVDGQILAINFTEGAVVKGGQVLFEIDPRPYEVQRTQAEGQKARDEALLENARLDVKRYEIAEEAVPKQQLATAKAAVAQYEGAVKTDQGLIDNAELQIKYCHIAAPVSGSIGLRLVDVGNMVHASDATGMAVITQLQPIAVRFSLPEDFIPQFIGKVKAGEKLQVEAYDRDRNLKRRLAVGTLLAIDSQIDETTSMLRLKATFENKDGALYPNQFVNVRLLVDTKRNAVIVPNAAVQPSLKGAFVYVVMPDSAVELRSVREGPSEGAETLIESGLAAGEIVVTDGVDRLQQGMKVSMTAPTTRPNATTRPTRPTPAS